MFAFVLAATLAAGQTAAADGDHRHEEAAPPAKDGHQHEQHKHEHHKHEHHKHEHRHEPGHDAHGAHGGMTGVLGSYPMARDAAGTAWQPDATPHEMGHERHGEWTVMAHLLLQGVWDWQDGPRGDEQAFVSGMAMAAARRDFQGGEILNLRAMLSPDPFMGKRGYPLLLAAGETADGVTHLIDRQHPHDLFMELSASLSLPLGEGRSVFLYAGLPGEPAFGPPAFMHRLTASWSPEAPISHHWLDSTHITFGVVTLGYVHDAWKLEVSRFKGREPDQHRFDIETPKLDSTAARLSFNPDEHWSLQLSFADQQSPEQLEPEVDAGKWSASAIYTRPLEDGGWVSATLAWGMKDARPGETTHAFTGEAAFSPGREWIFFARAERVESEELSPAHEIETVSKISAGALREFALNENLKLGVGALYAMNFVPDDLEPSYGGDPDGAMVFVRLSASN